MKRWKQISNVIVSKIVSKNVTVFVEETEELVVQVVIKKIQRKLVSTFKIKWNLYFILFD